MPKMLINLVVIEKQGVSLGWLLKWRRLQELGWELFFYCGAFVKKVQLNDVYVFNQNFAEIKKLGLRKATHLGYIFLVLKRHWTAILRLREILGQYALVYSPAASLDLTFLPALIKKVDKKVKWAVSFDNQVPLRDQGRKLIRWLAWLAFRASLLLIKKADVIFVTTPESIDFLVGKGFKKENLVLTGYAVEGDLIRRATVKSEYNFDILYLGRINQTKGIDDMLAVLQLVKAGEPKIKMTIVGRGDAAAEKEFKNKIEAGGLQDNIRFLGYVVGQEKFNILKSSKIFWFLSQSKSESFGMALLEAVCSGRPAIAYDLEQFKRIYQNGEVFICPKGDFRAVAEKTLEILKQEIFNNPAGELLLKEYGSWDKIGELEAAGLKRLNSEFL